MKMKKKITSVLLLVLLVFGLTACGAEPEHIEVDESAMTIPPVITYFYLQRAVTIGDAEFAEMQESVRHSIEIGAEGVGAEDLTLISAMSAYRDNIEDIGTVPQLSEQDLTNWLYYGVPSSAIPEYYYTADDDGVVIAHMMLHGDRHDAAIEYYYNKFSELTNVIVSVQLPLNESMKKAGVNTLIGMGTVFVMLILIMFIISALKIVPTLQSAFAKKKAGTKSSETSIDNTIAGIIERETAGAEETDDQELIAVIAAAIAAASAESGTDADFVVRSIRRVRYSG